MKSQNSILIAFFCILALHKLPTAEGFKVVAFGDGTWDQGHISFVQESKTFFPKLASSHGFEFQYTNNWGNLNDNFLSSVDVVLFLDNYPGDYNQQQAFQRYASNGGGWLGFHVSAFTTDSSWSWYHNTFLGSGNFAGNTWKPTQAYLQNEKGSSHGATGNVPNKFRTAANEWYKWSKNLRNNADIDVLMSIHPDSFPLGTNAGEIWYSGDYPVVWSNKKFNMVYWNMGHNDIDYSNGNADLSHTWENANEVQLVTDCIYWMAYKRQAQRQKDAAKASFNKFLYGQH